MIIDLKTAAKFLENNDDFLILTHAHPDGDTLGCGFALCEALKSCGKNAIVRCGDTAPEKYSYMGKLCEEDIEYENIIAVDVADAKLLGKEFEERFGGRVKLCIDHHGSNRLYAEQTLLDPSAAAACEIILEVIKELGVEVTKSIADCIFTGLSTDSGCFRYSNVTPRTLRMAAEMIESGADHSKINVIMFETKTRTYVALERLALESMKMFLDDRCAFITITRDMFRESGSDESEVDAIAAIPRQIEGVSVGVTMREKPDGTFKVSMRTHEGVDASAICAMLGGGGHPRAAGCTVDGDAQNARNLVVSCIEKYFKEELNS
ncbi:MAG: bifunctional oligoribonuclease/PAP phosphatase NrnA [Clostridia bacterium]|nr:bifunctional oligoribonuclease/PAP phosphatase NrnA [Clostridia bacterium]